MRPGYTRIKMDIQDQYLNIQVWDKHLTYSVLLLLFYEKSLKQKNNEFNKFYFQALFFYIASYQIFKNDVILISHESFLQKKESIQLYRSQFLEIHSLMAEIIEN